METQPNQPRDPRDSPAPKGTPRVIETDSRQQAAAPARTRVLSVDDSRDMSDMLARLISGMPDMVSVGTLSSAEGIAEQVVLCQADVVVLDLTMPGPSPLAAIGLIAQVAPQCRVIAFSGYDDPATREAARRAGAWELVSKSGEPNDIIRAIRRVASGPAGPNVTVK